MPLDLPDVDIQKELDLAANETAAPETPPEAAPEPAPAPEAKAEEKAPEEKAVAEPEHVQKTVPLPALQEARRESRELKERLRRMENENAQKYAEMQQRLEQLQKPQQEKPQFESDPATYLKNEVEDIKRAVTASQQTLQQTQAENQIKERLTASELEFVKEHPDYNEAARHLAQSISNNLALHGVIDPAQRNALLKREIQNITINALKVGKEPADFAYELAKNHGYVPKAVRDATQSNEKKLETIARGQEATQTLGSGGKRDSGSLTLDSLSKMDDDEFNALVLDEKKWAQIGSLLH